MSKRAVSQREFTFGSLFAGIGGFDKALERAGMVCRWQVEIDKKCRQVLAYHWPNVERMKDVKKAKGLPTVDLLCGGYPCQDHSVAGKRAGLAGERSGLWWEFHRIIAESHPRWVVIENVPGLRSSFSPVERPPFEIQTRDFDTREEAERWARSLSSEWEVDETSDLETVLASLAQLGYGWAYRSLDAQYDGLAQRRKRIFIVGYSGDPAGLARETPRSDIGRLSRVSAQVLFESESVCWDSAPGKKERQGVAAPLKASSPSRRAGGSAPVADEFVAGCFTGYSGGPDDNKAQAGHLIAFDTTQITSPGNHSNPKPGDPCHTLNSNSHPPALAFDWQSGGDVRLNISDEHTSSLQKSQTPAALVDNLSDTCYNQGITQEENLSNASAQETNAGEILSMLRQKIREEAFAQWGLGILDSLQQAKILRPSLYGESIYKKAQKGQSGLDDGSLSRQENSKTGTVREVWVSECLRRASQRWKLEEQFTRELGAYLSQLSRQGSPQTTALHCLWEASEGIGVLQQALSEIQEIRRPADGKRQKGDRGVKYGVRRFTPL